MLERRSKPEQIIPNYYMDLPDGKEKTVSKNTIPVEKRRTCTSKAKNNGSE